MDLRRTFEGAKSHISVPHLVSCPPSSSTPESQKRNRPPSLRSGRNHVDLQLLVFGREFPSYKSIRQVSCCSIHLATGWADTCWNRTSRRHSNRRPLAESKLCIACIHKKRDTSPKASFPSFHGHNAGKSARIEGRLQKTSLSRPIVQRRREASIRRRFHQCRRARLIGVVFHCCSFVAVVDLDINDSGYFLQSFPNSDRAHGAGQVLHVENSGLRRCREDHYRQADQQRSKEFSHNKSHSQW